MSNWFALTKKKIKFLKNRSKKGVQNFTSPWPKDRKLWDMQTTKATGARKLNTSIKEGSQYN